MVESDQSWQQTPRRSSRIKDLQSKKRKQQIDEIQRVDAENFFKLNPTLLKTKKRDFGLFFYFVAMLWGENFNEEAHAARRNEIFQAAMYFASKLKSFVYHGVDAVLPELNADLGVASDKTENNPCVVVFRNPWQVVNFLAFCQDSASQDAPMTLYLRLDNSAHFYSIV